MNITDRLFIFGMIFLTLNIVGCGGTPGGPGEELGSRCEENPALINCSEQERTLERALEQIENEIQLIIENFDGSNPLKKIASISNVPETVTGVLSDYDNLLTFSLDENEAYNDVVERVLEEIGGTSDSIDYLVVDNFQKHGLSSIGGSAGYSKIYLDSKYFDILTDYCRYLAKNSMPPLLDTELRTLTEYHYEVEAMRPSFYANNPSTLNSPDAENCVGMASSFIVFHELGHIFLDHGTINSALLIDAFAQSVASNEIVGVSYPVENEDVADVFSGIAMTKGKINLDYGLLGVEVLNGIADYLEGEESNTKEMYGRHSPLSVRKQLVEYGYNL